MNKHYKGHWFCHEKRDFKDSDKAPDGLELYCRTTTMGKTKRYQKTCFHKAHEEQWTRAAQERKEMSLSQSSNEES